MDLPLDDETLQRLYAWIDEIPLSRPKKNIARDFSDGILLAEVIAYYFPKLVQMHNYSSANSVKQKQYNWNTLNRKVLKRLHLHLTKDDIDDLVQCRAGAVEHLLVKLQLKIVSYKEKRPSSSDLRQGHPEQGSDDDQCVASPPSSSGSMSVASYGGLGSGATHRASYHSPAQSNDKQGELREAQLQQMREMNINSDGLSGAYDRGVSDASVMNYAPMLLNNSTADAIKDAAMVESLRGELLEKDQSIADLKETVQILEMKVQKLEQLVRLKDGKIQTLVAKLRSQKPQ